MRARLLACVPAGLGKRAYCACIRACVHACACVRASSVLFWAQTSLVLARHFRSSNADCACCPAGVESTRVGYIAGHVDEPSYEHVCTGMTGHTEAVQVRYDAKQIAFRELVGVFFEIHDPTTYHRQGNDVGSQYRSGIYFHTDEQQAAAVEVMAEAQERFQQPIVTEIQRASEFWPAEDYHQSYLQKGGQSAAKGAVDPIRCYG